MLQCSDFTTGKARLKAPKGQAVTFFGSDFSLLILFRRAPWRTNPKTTEFPRNRTVPRLRRGTCKKFKEMPRIPQRFLFGVKLLSHFWKRKKSAFAVHVASQAHQKPGLLKTVSSCMAGRSNKKYCRDQT